jgi:O-antigen ligase
MSPTIATVVYAVGILGLFWLDRDKKARTSPALWIPVIWLAIACSRSVAQWLQMGTPVESASQVLEGSPIDRLVYACLEVIGIAVLVGRKDRVARFLRGNGPIVFFFFFCLVSLAWSDYPDVGFKRWTKAVGDLVMILIVLGDRNPLAAIKRLIARVSYLLIPLSMLFIKYYPNIGRGYGFWAGETYYVGVTTNKNTLGLICMCFGVAALWRFLALWQEPKRRGRFRQMIPQVVILAMVFWLFAMINSMTSLSSFLMAGVLLFAANFRAIKRRPAIVHALIFAMLVVSASVVFLGVSPSALKAMGRNPTLTDRTEVWGVLLSLVRNPMFGTGFESFWLGPRLEKMWSLYWWKPNEAHNGYLEVYLNLGWVGVALLSVILATGYRTVFKAWRNRSPTGSLMLAYFFVGLVYNFTEAAFFRMLHPAWIFFLFAIVSVPVLQRKRIRSEVDAPLAVPALATEDIESQEEPLCNPLRHTFNTF